MSYKLNIGCGPSGINGWINYDWGILSLLSKFKIVRSLLTKISILPKNYAVEWPKIKLVNLKKRFPLKNSSVKFIYCSHVLEHFENWEAEHILEECYRVLERNGTVRIIVPDIKKLATNYLDCLNNNADSSCAKTICRLWWGFDKDDKPASFTQKMIRKNVRDHAWNYDLYSISELVKKIGFKNIQTCEFQKGAVPDIDKLDIKNYKNHSLYIEFNK